MRWYWGKSCVAVSLAVVLLFAAIGALHAQDGDAPVTVTTRDDLHVRVEPDAQVTSVGILPANTTVDVLVQFTNDANELWLRIPFENEEAWIAGWLVTINGDIEQVAVWSNAEDVPIETPIETVVMAEDELNTWPLSQAYGAYLLHGEVVNTWQSWGAELDNCIIATYFVDVRYLTPDGEEVIFSVPVGLSRLRDDGRYDVLLYGSSIPSMSLPLDSRLAAGTLEDSGLTIGDIVRLTIGNPTEEDSTFMRETDGIAIPLDNLLSFAESGDLAYLPLRIITNARYDLPVLIVLHFEIAEDN